MAPSHLSVAVLSAALQVVCLVGVDGASVQELQLVRDSARARPAVRFLVVPAAPDQFGASCLYPGLYEFWFAPPIP